LFEKLVKKLLATTFEKSSRKMKVDRTNFALLRHSFTPLIYFIGIGTAIFFIPQLRTLSISLFAGAGVLAVVIGFAAQKTFSNVVSGIFIAVSKPFRVGDLITVSGRMGYVEDITLRHTVIRNFENKRIIIPNAVISEEIIENFNITDDKICKFVEFGISYDSDVDKAMEIMEEEAKKHPLFLDTRTDEEKKQRKPAVMVKVLGYGDSSVNLRAWVWAKDPKDAYRIGWDLNKSIKKRFDAGGIEIPFPYRTLVFKDKKKVKKKK
jgi:small-conductance mechanosensitive channel